MNPSLSKDEVMQWLKLRTYRDGERTTSPGG